MEIKNLNETRSVVEKKEPDTSISAPEQTPELLPQGEEVEVFLPSNGKVYPNKICIRPWKVKEIKQLSSANKNNISTVLNTIMRESVRASVPLNDMTTGDEIFLYMWQRINSLGEVMDVSAECPLCREMATLSFHLDELQVTSLPDDFEEPMIMDLKKSKHKVTLRLSRKSDTDLADQYAHGVRKKDEGVIMLATIAATILEIDGKPVQSMHEKVTWLESLPPHPDFMALQGVQELFAHGHNLNEAPYSCSMCGGSDVMMLPFRSEFFMSTSQNRDIARDAILSHKRN